MTFDSAGHFEHTTANMPNLRAFLASTAFDLSEHRRIADDTLLRLKTSLAYRAMDRHRLGDIAAARVELAAVTLLEDIAMLCSLRGQQHAGHCLDLGQSDHCRLVAEAGIRIAQRNNWKPRSTTACGRCASAVTGFA